jgi:hypothetical protein
MIEMLKRHETEVLRLTGHMWNKVASFAATPVCAVRRVAVEGSVATVDNAAERARQQMGRPSMSASRKVPVDAPTQEPRLRSENSPHRGRYGGCAGWKSALYALTQALQPRVVVPLVRFGGLGGEFSQHDFAEVVVRYHDAKETTVRFSTSRLQYPRRMEVTLSPDVRTETFVPTPVEHLDAFGGIPLVAVFDRPKPVTLKWGRDGVVTECNPTFAGATLDLGSAWKSAGGRGPKRRAVSRI